MNVILEGPDGGGKSTLAQYLGSALDLRVQQGSGPPKSMAELNTRIAQYLYMEGVIFDRHPCVSQPIYGMLRKLGDACEMPDPHLIDQFYASDTFIVYCRNDSLERHVVKEGEKQSHIDALTDNWGRIVEMYDQWALRHADIIYRIGDDRSVITDIIRVIAC